MESAARSGAIVAEEIAAEFGTVRRISLPPVETTGLVRLLRRKDPRSEPRTSPAG
jgi:hypothetical protein